MELNGYRLLLPEGTLDYFDLVDVKESVNEVVFYLEEKNIVPSSRMEPSGRALSRSASRVASLKMPSSSVRIKKRPVRWSDVYKRQVVSQRVPAGMTMMYHAQERIVNLPGSEITGQRGGIHNSVTRCV